MSAYYGQCPFCQKPLTAAHICVALLTGGKMKTQKHFDNLTEITVQIECLDDNTLLGLIRASHAGERIQISRDGEDWVDIQEPLWRKGHYYRVAPATKPSINWNHVNEKYVLLRQLVNTDIILEDEHGNFVRPHAFASFKPGNYRGSCTVRRPK